MAPARARFVRAESPIASIQNCGGPNIEHCPNWLSGLNHGPPHSLHPPPKTAQEGSTWRRRADHVHPPSPLSRALPSPALQRRFHRNERVHRTRTRPRSGGNRGRCLTQSNTLRTPRQKEVLATAETAPAPPHTSFSVFPPSFLSPLPRTFFPFFFLALRYAARSA